MIPKVVFSTSLVLIIFAGTLSQFSLNAAWAHNEIWGTPSDDSLIGTDSIDDIRGFEGNDIIDGLDGDDRLYGKEGDDAIYGREGGDSMYGWSGDDKLGGGEGNDKIYGGIGADRLFGDDGNDILFGSEGDDRLYGGEGADIFNCGRGFDIVTDYNPTEGDTLNADCEGVTDTSQVIWSQLRGVNFRSPILKDIFPDDPDHPPNFIPKSMEILHDNGFNLIRVPFFWERYLEDPDAFMTEIGEIAQRADENGIYVIYDFHHYFTSSHFSVWAEGFPPDYLSAYPPSPDYDVEARPFWTDFLDKALEVDGESIWDLQADFLIRIIDRVDHYDNVIGYEILNEPNLFEKSQYEKLGVYHSYVAGRLREHTDKFLVFDRETAHGGLVRQPGLEPLIVPNEAGSMIYGPHLYELPAPGSQGETQVERFKTWSAEWDTPVLIGEFSATNQEEMDIFVGTFRDSGFAWTYWTWGCFTCKEGRILVDEHLNTTEYFDYLVNSIKKFY